MAQFTNQATLSYNGVTTSSNIVTGEITQVLNMWKDAVIDTYQVDDILTYVISIQNSGTSNYTGLTVTDNLGSYSFGTGDLVPLSFTGDPVLYYLNGVLQASPTVVAGPPLEIENISVLAGTSTVLIYRVQVNEYAPINTGGTITNTATLSGGGISSDITADEVVTAVAGPTLSIVKSVTPTTIVENGEITYRFTIENTGAAAADAAANIIISDTFDPILSGITVELNGVIWPASNYTYSEVTGDFATDAGAITVPAATITQDATTGVWTTVPGVTILEVTGTI